MRLDFKNIHEQIASLAEMVEVIEYETNVEDFYFIRELEKYRFEGYIEVCWSRVYTKGTYTDDFCNFELFDFCAEDDDLVEYLENYTLEELQLKIA